MKHTDCQTKILHYVFISCNEEKKSKIGMPEVSRYGLVDFSPIFYPPPPNSMIFASVCFQSCKILPTVTNNILPGRDLSPYPATKCTLIPNECSLNFPLSYLLTWHQNGI